MENVKNNLVEMESKNYLKGACFIVKEEAMYDIAYLCKMLSFQANLNQNIKKDLYITLMDKSHINIPNGISMEYKLIFKNQEHFNDFYQKLEQLANDNISILDINVKNSLLTLYQYFYTIQGILNEIPRITLTTKEKLSIEETYELSNRVLLYLGVTLNNEITNLAEEMKDYIFDATYKVSLKDISEKLDFIISEIEDPENEYQDTILNQTILKYIHLIILEAHNIRKINVTQEEVESLVEEMFTKIDEESKNASISSIIEKTTKEKTKAKPLLNKEI